MLAFTSNLSTDRIMSYRYIWHTLLTGLLTILPLMLTLYLVFWLGKAAESFVGGLLMVFIPDDWYIPGAGLLTGLILVFLLGLMTKSLLLKRAMDYGEAYLYRIPVIKSIYSSLKDLTDFFAKPGKDDFHEVVLVTFNAGGTEIRMMGFVTSRNGGKAASDHDEDDMLMVYLPMSYQIGGYTVTVHRSAVTPLDMRLEDAMRHVLTAGMAKDIHQQPEGLKQPAA